MLRPVANRPRLVVHDYSGHPFQAQLSRELARRGYEILHLHCPSYRTGKGALDKRPEDPPTFSVDAVALDGEFEKYSAWKRVLQEREYARRLVRRIAEFAPDVVVSSNNPLFAQQLLLAECERRGIRFVFWQQDLYSVAMKRILAERVPLVGEAVGRSFIALESALVRRSDAVVTIAEDFGPTVARWRLASDRVWVIENWAPLDELPTRPRDNPWARAHGLAGTRALLYSGTLGLKHNPELLLALARRFRSEPDVRVVVVSDGPGWEYLRGRAREERLDNLVTLPFQPYHELPDVLATGDVLVSVLELEAGFFSVPSKVLTYHCAGRALLAAVPAVNLAASVIRRAESGLVVDPRDQRGFELAAERLLADAALRARLGARARRYAEQTFDIATIGDRFEGVIEDVYSRRDGPGTGNGALRAQRWQTTRLSS